MERQAKKQNKTKQNKTIWFLLLADKLETHQVFDEDASLAADPKTKFSPWIPPWYSVYSVDKS